MVAVTMSEDVDEGEEGKDGGDGDGLGLWH